VAEDEEQQNPKQLPGDVLVKLTGIAWDAIEKPALGHEGEFIIRYRIIGDGSDLLATGVTRTYCKARVIGLKPVPPENEVFPQMPVGRNAQQQLPLAESDEEE
jgi:hypothetical protein